MSPPHDRRAAGTWDYDHRSSKRDSLWLGGLVPSRRRRRGLHRRRRREGTIPPYVRTYGRVSVRGLAPGGLNVRTYARISSRESAAPAGLLDARTYVRTYSVRVSVRGLAPAGLNVGTPGSAVRSHTPPYVRTPVLVPPNGDMGLRPPIFEKPSHPYF